MWQKTEPFALPAELRAQIGHFSIKKVMKNRFFEIFGFEEKSRKTRLVNGKRTSAAGCSFIWLQTQRPPR